MKYMVNCTGCGSSYEVDMSFRPGFCVKCGCGDERVAVAPVKNKARLRAEDAMMHLDEIGPKMEAAREAYLALMVEYEDELQLLRQYKKREIVSEEEVNEYAVRGYKRISLNDALKEYRAKKRE